MKHLKCKQNQSVQHAASMAEHHVITLHYWESVQIAWTNTWILLCCSVKWSRYKWIKKLQIHCLCFFTENSSKEATQTASMLKLALSSFPWSSSVDQVSAWYIKKKKSAFLTNSVHLKLKNNMICQT